MPQENWFYDFVFLGCEVTPEVNINKDKYNIKLTIPGPDMYEMEMGCSSPQQYVKWMAACRLASKGKTMADPTYEMEMSGVRTFLNMQNDVKDSSKDDGDYDAGAHVSFIKTNCAINCILVLIKMYLDQSCHI